MRRVVMIGGLMVVLLMGSVVAAQGLDAPFVDTVPQGWGWWCDSARCVLVPNNAAAGPQHRFVMVGRDLDTENLLLAWLAPAGDAEVSWTGEFETYDRIWAGQIVEGNGAKALAADAADWSVIALSVAGQWEKDASVFNAVLRAEE